MTTNRVGKAHDLISFARSSRGFAMRKVSYGSNFVNNGYFNTDATGWSVTSNAVLSVASSQLTITSTAASGAYQDITTIPGRIYKLQWAFTEGTVAHADMSMRIYYNGSFSGDFINAMPKDGGATFRARQNTTRIYLRNGSAGTSTWDSVTCQEAFLDTPGANTELFDHPADEPRIEVDKDHNSLGLLMENAATQLMRHSHFHSNWTEYACSMTENQFSPTRNREAYLFQRTVTSANYLTRSETKSGSALTLTGSFYVKKGNAQYFAMRVQGSYPNRCEAIFDLNDGTVHSTNPIGSFSNDTGRITDVGNGWFRCSLTCTTDTATTVALLASFNTNAAAIDGTDGNGVGANGYIFGAQLEERVAASSYIPTKGATGTRNADIATIPEYKFGMDQVPNNTANGMTIYVEFSPLITPYTNYNRVISVGEEGGNNELAMNTNQGSGAIYPNVQQFGVSGVQYTGNAFSTEMGTYYKAAYSLAHNDFDGAYNGTLLGGDTSVNVPKKMDRIAIASNAYNLGSHGEFYIKDVKFYPRKLTNTELQELTS